MIGTTKFFSNFFCFMIFFSFFSYLCTLFRYAGLEEVHIKQWVDGADA